MRFYPTRIHKAFLCFVFLSILINFACSKDSDLLVDSILQEESATSVLEVESEEELVEEAAEEETTSEINSDETTEIRTISFSPIHDAHLQSGKGYNQNIIRLEEGHRTSYLMFDLSPISIVNGKITDATLQFTINSDDGSGTVTVFKGSSSDWTENSISETTAPIIDNELGSIAKEYKIGTTEAIVLNADDMTAEISTLILNHLGANDLAFASKEHIQGIGPKLVLSYEVAENADEIVIEEETTNNETTSEETTEEQTDENEEPIAIADATPSSGGVELMVSFKGSSSTDDNSISSYSWDFKDGSTSAEADPVHTFISVGTFEVVLTVTDEAGLSTTDTVTITVNETANEAPISVASVSSTTGVAPLAVTFTGDQSTDDNAISSYLWDFKDGSTTNTANASHTFTSSGTYLVELIVKDENGLSNKTITTITVTDPVNSAPIAVIDGNPSTGSAPLSVQFVAGNSSDDNAITSYFWDLKDGATSTTLNPYHTYTTPGTYEVELTVTDAAGLTDTKTITIVVNEAENQAPVAVVSANPTTGNAPLNVQFVGGNSTDDKGVTGYLWDFKDGTTGTSNNPSHLFTNPGSYVVNLTITDAEGLTSSSSITITVNSNGGSGNPADGYYVTTSGNSSNNGLSENSAWSLEHAVDIAQAGDIVYVKAGNYGNKQLTPENPGFSGSPIKFIGYTNTPGDIVSNSGSTFGYGQQLSSSKMPLLVGYAPNGEGQGTAIRTFQPYLHFENFQITKYKQGITSFANNVILKNIIVVDMGDFNPAHTYPTSTSDAFLNYSGTGIILQGNNSELHNSFVLNCGAQGITVSNGNNMSGSNNKVYSNSHVNPMDYYFLLGENTTNSNFNNTTVHRVGQLRHLGHGISMKGNGTISGNTINGFTIINTFLAIQFPKTSNNIIKNGTITKESNINNTTPEAAGIRLANGSHHNLFQNINLNNCSILFQDWNDGLAGDVSDASDNNTFDNVNVTNAFSAIAFSYADVTNHTSGADNNVFKNCSFSNLEYLFEVDRANSNTTLSNCSISNIQKFSKERIPGGPSYSLNVSYSNCSWSNTGFTPPN